jgi:hypothetical protein
MVGQFPANLMLLSALEAVSVRALECYCCLSVSGLRIDHDATINQNSENQSNVGERCNSHGDSVLLREDDGVCLQEEVQDFVDECYVDSEQIHDKFEKEKLERKQRVYADQVVESFRRSCDGRKCSSLLPKQFGMEGKDSGNLTYSIHRHPR